MLFANLYQEHFEWEIFQRADAADKVQELPNTLI